MSPRGLFETRFDLNMAMVGSYRHGGQHVSEHLHKRLHGMIEEVDKVTIDETIAFTKRLGGSLDVTREQVNDG